MNPERGAAAMIRHESTQSPVAGSPEAGQEEAPRPSAGRRQSLAEFTGAGYDKGRPLVIQVLWFAVMNLIFMKWWCPPTLRPIILRAFGAKIGCRVLIRHQVRIHWPWKLEVGSNTWIGEDTWLQNLENIHIGSDVSISQSVHLVTGSHRIDSPTFEYDNGPIHIDDQVWLATGATVLRRVRVGRAAVIGAHALVQRDVGPGQLVRCTQNTQSSREAARGSR